MTTRTIPFLAMGLLLGTAQLTAQSMEQFTILCFNDTHSNLAAGGPRTPWLWGTQGGVARAATIIERERRLGGNLVVLHGGDFSVGDPFYNFFYAVPALQLMARLGYDVVTLGNHEFDLTPDALLGSLLQAFPSGVPFDLVSSNLEQHPLAPTPHPLLGFVQQYTIEERGGLRIGIFGMTTPETDLFSQPYPLTLSQDLGVIAATMVGTLAAQGCDVVVMLSHLGVELDRDLASAIPGIDVVVSAHDHYEIEEPVAITGPTGDTVYQVQTGGFYRQIGRLQLSFDAGQVTVDDYDLIDLDWRVPQDCQVRREVANLQWNVERLFPGMYTHRVAYVARTLDEKTSNLDQPGRHDTAVGSRMADALQVWGGTDLSIVPGASSAQPLYRGPIVPADVLRMVSYGFNTFNGIGYRLATFNMSGMALLMGLEITLADLSEDSDYIAQVSEGFSYTYDPRQPPGSRLVSATLHGQPIDPMGTYSLTTNEFVLGVFGYLGLPVFDVQVHEISEFEVVLEYVQAQRVLTPRYWPPRVQAVF